MQRTHSFFERKTLSSSFALFFVFAMLLLVPTRQAHALLVLDKFNLVQNTWSNISESISAGATPISAATGLTQQTKEWGLDSIANLMAKMMLQRITVQTVNWINNGFEGNPAFVTDPGVFFGNVADQTASQIFLGADSPLNQLCSPFRAEVRLALVKNYLIDQNNQFACTFSRIGANFENFTRDFTQGGWEAWFVLTQENQNNPYGAYMQGQELLRTSINVQQGKYQQQLNWGRGFLSYERCRRDYVPPPSEGRQCIKFERLTVGGPEPRCLRYEETNVNGEAITCPASEKETVTPGSVINEQLGRTFGSTFAQLEAADEINEIVNALMAQMLTQVFSGIQGGIRNLSRGDTSNPSRASLLDQLEATTRQDAFNTEAQAITSGIPQAPTPVQTPTEAEIRQQVELERQLFLNQQIQDGQNNNENP